MDKLLSESERKMRLSVDHMRIELGKVRTGRASLTLVEDIKVDYYGKLGRRGDLRGRHRQPILHHRYRRFSARG